MDATTLLEFAQRAAVASDVSFSIGPNGSQWVMNIKDAVSYIGTDDTVEALKVAVRALLALLPEGPLQTEGYTLLGV